MFKKLMFFTSCAFILSSCATSPMKFNLAPGTNQDDYHRAIRECGGDYRKGGYFAFGPLFFVAGATVVMEAIRHKQYQNKMVEAQKCMEARGYKCTDNCQIEEKESGKTSSAIAQQNIEPATRIEQKAMGASAEGGSRVSTPSRINASLVSKCVVDFPRDFAAQANCVNPPGWSEAKQQVKEKCAGDADCVRRNEQVEGWMKLNRQ
ncbi:MAG: hypothetical protein C0392_11585 [Syntrophus sp. (in: bacteria)]|nr:hypothetical protein [Syntrophus sp. (in: bacteria)]